MAVRDRSGKARREDVDIGNAMFRDRGQATTGDVGRGL